MRAAVFSGTSDGRELCGFLAELGLEVEVYVATEYGASLMDGLTVHVGRLDSKAMSEATKDCDIVVDATHPYAAEATVNIKRACESNGTEYLRLVRDDTEHKDCISVSNTAAAVSFLKETEGRIFISTGSKELSEFEPVGDRAAARVLDTETVREKCKGMAISDIIYKMPPYSYEDNLNDFKGCKYLVTKDSGTAGGTAEKLDAARKLGITVVLIERPRFGQDGYSLSELKDILRRRYV